MAIAVAVVYSDQPWIPMAIAAIGEFDLRVFRREIPVWRDLFNRAQLVIATGVSALVIQLGAGAPFEQQLLWVVPAGVAHFIFNFGLVSIAIQRDTGEPLRKAIALGVPRTRGMFALTHVLFVLLGATTAVIYLSSPYGRWLVPASLVPLFFARTSMEAGSKQLELATDLAQKNQALLDATDAVFRERESERTRIAEEIHDTTLQHLAAVSLMTRKARSAVETGESGVAVDALDAVAASADESLDTLRQSIMDLRRSQLESEDLQTAVNEFVRNVQTLWDVPVDVHWELPSSPPVPVAMAAFQVIHEGVINALKHSESTSIAIRAKEDDGSLRISVEDNGRGFDPIRLDTEGHLGIELMLRRAAAVGGELAIDSTPNESTRILLTVPTAR